MPFKTNEYFHSHYNIKYKIGSGATSTVYLIESKDHKLYALKLLNMQKLIEGKNKPIEEAKKLVKISIEREFKLLKKIKNIPNCITYIDFYDKLIVFEKEYIGIVMEYFKGFELNNIINCLINYPSEPLPNSIIYKFFLDTLTSLKELHKLNIIHRDIKPQNILVDEQCNFKLIDFGYSCIVNDPDLIIRCKNNIVGTMAYIDPTIFEPYDKNNYELLKSTDIWSLGVVAYHFTNKRRLFGNSVEEVKKNLSNKIPIKSNYYDEDINKLISYCLKYDYKQRKTAQELYDLVIKMIDEKFSNDLDMLEDKQLKELVKQKEDFLIASLNELSMNKQDIKLRKIIERIFPLAIEYKKEKLISLIKQKFFGYIPIDDDEYFF